MDSSDSIFGLILFKLGYMCFASPSFVLLWPEFKVRQSSNKQSEGGLNDFDKSNQQKYFMLTQLEIRVYNLKQLAELYQVSRTTMRRWLQPLKPALIEMGYRGGRLFTHKQVEFIFNFFGPPGRKRALPMAV